jgi:hypothetical protein
MTTLTPLDSIPELAALASAKAERQSRSLTLAAPRAPRISRSHAGARPGGASADDSDDSQRFGIGQSPQRVISSPMRSVSAVQAI